MAANSNFVSQGAPVLGGFAQPSPGITEAVVTPADPSGNAYATSLAASGTANLQTAAYRDSIATVQAGSKAAAPSAGGTCVSITPGTVGLWEITGLLGITGTTVAATDTNNFQLVANGSTLISTITFPVQSTTGSSTQGVFGPLVVNMTGTANTVQVQAAANSTGSSVYSATLVARRVG
jgi:hypothetical protein